MKVKMCAPAVSVFHNHQASKEKNLSLRLLSPYSFLQKYIYSFLQKFIWHLQYYSLSPIKNKFLIPSLSPQSATKEATVFWFSQVQNLETSNSCVSSSSSRGWRANKHWVRATCPLATLTRSWLDVDVKQQATRCLIISFGPSREANATICHNVTSPVSGEENH